MRNILNFLLRYNSWILFVVYVVLSCILIFSNNTYHQALYMTSANAVSASLNSVRTNFTGYLGLKETNALLEGENARLHAQVLDLQRQLQNTRELIPDTTSIIPQPERFSYIVASVLSNSTSRPHNYLTLNKGKRQGVKPGMGVVNSMGIVGIINVCGDNTSRVISLLNVGQHFSVKIKGTPYVGSLAWRYGNSNVAYMEEVPRHAKYRKGDLVISSGFSTTFPEGIPVGKIICATTRQTDNYLTLKVKLLPDFDRLSTVWVINDIYKIELDTLTNHDIKTE